MTTIIIIMFIIIIIKDRLIDSLFIQGMQRSEDSNSSQSAICNIK